MNSWAKYLSVTHEKCYKTPEVKQLLLPLVDWRSDRFEETEHIGEITLDPFNHQAPGYQETVLVFTPDSAAPCFQSPDTDW